MHGQEDNFSDRKNVRGGPCAARRGREHDLAQGHPKPLQRGAWIGEDGRRGSPNTTHALNEIIEEKVGNGWFW